MANLNQNDELFSSNLDAKLDFLNERKTSSGNGLYTIDLAKAKDKKKGYRSVIRLLPNLKRDGTIGNSGIERIINFVDIKSAKELSGVFDSPKNFDKRAKCPISDLYFTLHNSKNAILQEKAKCLKYSSKYYSYALVLEDEQMPELVGKIVILQYGKQIGNKILSEKNGELNTPCNVFDLTKGKDLVIICREITTPDGETQPSYIDSGFRSASPISIYNAETNKFKTVPLNQAGQIDVKYQTIIREFLLNREHELEEFGPKELTEEQHAKIGEIISFLTGKVSNSFNSSNNSKPTASDLESEDVVSNSKPFSANTEDEEDFFNNL